MTEVRTASLGLSAGVLAVLLTWWAPLSAQPGDATKQAREAYEAGDRLAKEGKWAEATAAFSRADQLAPNDTALDAALEASLRAGDPVVGMGLVERASRSESARALPVVARARASFGPRVGAIDVACVAEATPCAVTIDDRRISVTRTWALPGPHRVVFEQAGGAALSIDVTAGEIARVSPPPPTSSGSPDGGQTITVPPPPSSGASPLWVLLPAALTVGFGVTTVVFGVRTKDLEADLLALDGGRIGDYEEARAIYDEGETAEDVTNVFLGLSIASAVATAAVAIFVVDWSSEDPSRSTAVRAVVVPTAGGAAAVVEGVF